jgi:hypothetical protein
MTSLYKLGDVAACRRAAWVLGAVHFNVNFKRLTKLINSAYFGEWTT